MPGSRRLGSPTSEDLDVAQVHQLIDEQHDGRTLGIIGEKTVNVLELNLALDKLSS